MASEPESSHVVASYPSGRPAKLFSTDGSGVVYYESGKVAVVVALVPTPNGNKFNRYFYDDDKANTLVASLDEHIVGFAVDNTGDPKGLRMVFTDKNAIVSTNEGTILREWKWDRSSQGAGKPPKEPLKVRLNSSLELTYTNRRTIDVVFRTEGLSERFECGEQLRRFDRYLDKCNRVQFGPDRGKIIPDIEFKTLVKRQEEMEERLLAKRNLNRPQSCNIKHNERVRSILSGLEEHFAPFEEKIATSNFGTTFMAEGWRESAKAATMSEVPRVFETGNEVGPVPAYGDLGCTIKSDTARKGLQLGAKIPDKWPTELEVRMGLRKTNPALPRSAMLRGASGRYSSSSPVDPGLEPLLKLPSVHRHTFDEVIGGHPGKLIAVLCLRDDDPLCVRARQIFEVINGRLAKIAADNTQAGTKLPAVVYQFRMTEGRLLSSRYGVTTIPAFLMFYEGKLVRGGVLGARPINLQREVTPPRLLLWELNFRSQIQFERLLKAKHWQHELAISQNDATRHVKYRAGISSANAVTFYGIVMIDSTVPVSEASTVAQLARRSAAASPRGASLVVSLLPMGAVANSGLEDGLVASPTKVQLIDGVCDVAITRPLKSTSLEGLSRAFFAHLERTRGAEAAEPTENVTHYGTKKTDILRLMREALADGRKGHFLKDGWRLGMKLSVNAAEFRGVQLELAEGKYPTSM